MAEDDFGIVGLEFYFPRHYIPLESLEEQDNCSGKYTQGLGLGEMAYCDADEDVCSISLTAAKRLLEKYEIPPTSIGFLEVGTESPVDKCKTVKSVLVGQLLANHGQTTPDVHGGQTTGACYAGTQALLNAIYWLRCYWPLKKQYALVVCADIAVYAEGPARPTGGAGAIAFLLGPNAPLMIEWALLARSVGDVPDFYKPIGGPSTEYPHVDGGLSIRTYLAALDECYIRYREAYSKLAGGAECSVSHSFNAVLFHSPFCRLVEKALARLNYLDLCHGSTPLGAKSGGGGSNGHMGEDDASSMPQALAYYRDTMSMEETLTSRDFTKASVEAARPLFARTTEPHLEFNRRLGNMYTASLYAQLVALIANSGTRKKQRLGGGLEEDEDVAEVNREIEEGPAKREEEELNAHRILLYSYGGGFEAGMYSMHFKINANSVGAYRRMVASAKDARSRLNQRLPSSAAEFAAALKAREVLIASDEAVCSAPKGQQQPPNRVENRSHEDTTTTNSNNHVGAAPPLAGANGGIVSAGKTQQSHFPGTCYLYHIDAKCRRHYAWVPEEGQK